MLSVAILTLGLALHGRLASAVPNVTVVSVGPGSCVFWPGWIPTRETDTTSPFQFQIDQSDDPASDGLIANDYFADRVLNSLNATVNTYTLSFRLNRSPYMGAAYNYRCFDGYPYFGNKLDMQKEMNWPITVSYKDGTSSLKADPDGNRNNGYRLAPCWHEIGGVRQPDMCRRFFLLPLCALLSL